MGKLNIVFVLMMFLFASNATAQIRESLNAYNKIEIFGKLNIRLEKSDYDSILIKSSEYDISQVKFEVADSILSVKLLSEFPPEIKVNLIIQFKHIDGIEAGGGAKIYNRGSIESKIFALRAKSGSEFDLLVNIDSANVEVNKGAFVRLTGENRYLSIKTSTGGAFRSTKMTNVITDAILNGGTVEINTADYLNAKVSLGGSLKYVEQPKKIDRKERMGGTIKKLEDF